MIIIINDSISAIKRNIKDEMEWLSISLFLSCF